MHHVSKSILKGATIKIILISIPFIYLIWNISKSQRMFKPYNSYVRALNLAEGLDEYKSKIGVWPTNLVQLVEVRPDLNNDLVDGYGHAMVLMYARDYGEVISYGKDGKPGGNNQFDADIVVRFPENTETNAHWNDKVGTRFKSRTARGLW